MSIVMGLDQHRAQITAEWLDTETGEVSRSRVAPADRASVRRFLGRFSGRQLEVGLEATTGWRFVVEELHRVGASVHLAEPAEMSGLRGPKKRAKTDWADAPHLRELLMIGRLPESWIPPDHILDLRARVRLRHTLSHQRCEWQQRIQSVLYHHGCPSRRQLMVGDRREWLATQPLPPTAREQITVYIAIIDALDAQMGPLDKELYSYITVKQSDQRRRPGHLSRQGPPALRWALYEAAQVARHPRSPDRAYYLQAAERIGGNRACLAVARKHAARGLAGVGLADARRPARGEMQESSGARVASPRSGAGHGSVNACLRRSAFAGASRFRPRARLSCRGPTSGRGL